MTGIQALLDIMARLRDPEEGCPWDLEQDFASISPFTIEEAYEVDEAIATGDLESIRDELGDLLFQVVFQARIAEEQGAFDFSGVVEAISSKLVRRHPHVFAGAETPQTLDDQTATWESIKEAERAASGMNDGTGAEPDVFAGIPRNLPALARSAKIAGRLERLGALSADLSAPPSGPTLSSRLDRVREALDQTESRLGDSVSPPDRESALRLVGVGLRSWVGLARGMGVDPEQALRQLDDAQVEEIRRAKAGSASGPSPEAKAHQAGNSPHR
jgi:MazG family protein